MRFTICGQKLMETRPLYIWGDPDMSRIKEAKTSMNLDFLVIPRRFEERGLNDRVLAYEKVPPRLCDYALIGPQTSQEGIVAALRWVLLGGDDPRAETIQKTLEGIFGFGVKELDTTETDDYIKDQNLKKASVRFRLDESGDSREGRRK